VLEGWEPLPEGVALLDGALRDEGHPVVVLTASLPHPVPMNGDFHALDVVLHVHHDLVAFAHLDTRSGDHPIRRQNPALDTVGQDTLATRPHRVRRIRRAHLTGPGSIGIRLR
jgi:hypothetical protein